MRFQIITEKEHYSLGDKSNKSCSLLIEITNNIGLNEIKNANAYNER